ncbi:hypothetical protein D9615_006252 [Tricholomella constricta]|uniref:Uncharacterized protein n=1 Tax=Tricholomella constricta TaxID=117010 RepID=A0A8H5M429_9AGAR|nr:hypothetical protein D9615_006252 [Tricholomella constricta]
MSSTITKPPGHDSGIYEFGNDMICILVTFIYQHYVGTSTPTTPEPYSSLVFLNGLPPSQATRTVESPPSRTVPLLISQCDSSVVVFGQLAGGLTLLILIAGRITFSGKPSHTTYLSQGNFQPLREDGDDGGGGNRKTGNGAKNSGARAPASRQLPVSSSFILAVLLTLLYGTAAAFVFTQVAPERAAPFTRMLYRTVRALARPQDLFLTFRLFKAVYERVRALPLFRVNSTRDRYKGSRTLSWIRASASSVIGNIRRVARDMLLKLVVPVVAVDRKDDRDKDNNSGRDDGDDDSYSYDICISECGSGPSYGYDDGSSSGSYTLSESVRIKPEDAPKVPHTSITLVDDHDHDHTQEEDDSDERRAEVALGKKPMSMQLNPEASPFEPKAASSACILPTTVDRSVPATSPTTPTPLDKNLMNLGYWAPNPNLNSNADRALAIAISKPKDRPGKKERQEIIEREQRQRLEDIRTEMLGKAGPVICQYPAPQPHSVGHSRANNTDGHGHVSFAPPVPWKAERVMREYPAPHSVVPSRANNIHVQVGSAPPLPWKVMREYPAPHSVMHSRANNIHVQVTPVPRLPPAPEPLRPPPALAGVWAPPQSAVALVKDIRTAMLGKAGPVICEYPAPQFHSVVHSRANNTDGHVSFASSIPWKAERVMREYPAPHSVMHSRANNIHVQVTPVPRLPPAPEPLRPPPALAGVWAPPQSAFAPLTIAEPPPPAVRTEDEITATIERKRRRNLARKCRRLEGQRARDHHHHHDSEDAELEGAAFATYPSDEEHDDSDHAPFAGQSRSVAIGHSLDAPPWPRYAIGCDSTRI